MLAEFEAAGPMSAAAERLREEGFHDIIGFAPQDLPELAESMHAPRTRLPLIVLCAGLFGSVFAYGVQWYTAAVSYPLIVGGRPVHAAPAFMLITFETAVLFGACAGFVGFFWLLGLPRLWAPVAEIPAFERASVDRFWVGVSREDPHFDPIRIAAVLETLRPLRVVDLQVEVGA
jgi:hypothetical protein